MAYANALLPMAVDVPDIAGAYFRGQQMYGAQQEQQAQNALRAAMQQYGPAAMRGDQNALAQLAQFDPQLGLSMMGDQQAMDLRGRQDARAERESASGMRLDEARLGQIREQQRQATAEHAMRMDAATREREAAESQRETAMLTMAYRSGKDEWNRVAPGILGGQAISFEDAPYIIAGAQGSVEGLLSGNEQFRQATPEEAAGYGAVAGQFGPDGRFYALNPPSGMTIESDGSGGFSLAQGPGVAAASKPLNEGQSKNVIFASRAEGSLPGLEATAGALTSRINQAAGAVPLGLGKDFQSPEYQMAQQAGEEFLTAILRKDTGAAITAQEQQIYGDVYLPRPGDSPEVQAQKAASRQRAVDALRRGMTPAEILALEKGNPSEPASSAGQTTPVDESIDSILERYR